MKEDSQEEEKTQEDVHTATSRSRDSSLHSDLMELPETTQATTREASS